MNVFISADIEGVTGLVSWDRQCGGPDGAIYDWPFARRMMTHDVNAAIRGARAAGAHRIVVRDAHGSSKNLLVDELEPGVELVSGLPSGHQGMTTGLEEGFGAVFLVGYHAMAGTAHGVMEHTINGNTHGLWINDRACGEQALAAYSAGELGVPVALVTSDAAGCAEAQALVEGVEVAVTKHGLGRYLARLEHPSVTGERIYEAARRAVEGARYGRTRPLRAESPVRIRLEQNRTEEADSIARQIGWSRDGAYALTYEAGDWWTAHRALWTAFSAASSAAGLQR